MEIKMAKHYGICFGVRDAIEMARQIAGKEPLTLLGEIVHNPIVIQRMEQWGIQRGKLEDVTAPTPAVMITAHGTATRTKISWQKKGHRIFDGTCPLVHKAHAALAALVADGYFPVVLGKRNHIEVRGLIGDFPEACVVEERSDCEKIPPASKIGVIAQTTYPESRAAAILEKLEKAHPESEIRFVDTICQPTKERQRALQELCSQVDVMIIIGGSGSNNTRELVATAHRNGIPAHHIEKASDLKGEWFQGVHRVGVTAGTSTLEETVRSVCIRLQKIGCHLQQEVIA